MARKKSKGMDTRMIVVIAVVVAIILFILFMTYQGTKETEEVAELGSIGISPEGKPEGFCFDPEHEIGCDGIGYFQYSKSDLDERCTPINPTAALGSCYLA